MPLPSDAILLIQCFLGFSCMIDMNEFLRLLWNDCPNFVCPLDSLWLRLYSNKKTSLHRQLFLHIDNICCANCCDINLLIENLTSCIAYTRSSVREPLSDTLFPSPGYSENPLNRDHRLFVWRYLSRSFDPVRRLLLNAWHPFDDVSTVHCTPVSTSGIPVRSQFIAFDSEQERMRRLRKSALRPSVRLFECKECRVACPFHPTRSPRLPAFSLTSPVVIRCAASQPIRSKKRIFCKYCFAHNLPFAHEFMTCPVWNLYGRPIFKKGMFINLSAVTVRTRISGTRVSRR